MSTRWPPLPLPLVVYPERPACTLKALTQLDLPELMAIEQTSHTYPWKEAHFRSSLQAHQVLGLIDQNRILAYAVISFVVGEAELLLFVVDQRQQGQGIGRTFLRALLELSGQRAQTLFLEVRASNFKAIGLYESLGFNQVGERPGYYPLPNHQSENALIYAIELPILSVD